MRARTYTNLKDQQAGIQAIQRIANVQPGYGIYAMDHNRIQVQHRLVPFAAGYGQSDADISPGAALAIGVGGLVLTGVLVLGGYLLLAYGIGWAATKGYQRAKRKKRK